MKSNLLNRKPSEVIKTEIRVLPEVEDKDGTYPEQWIIDDLGAVLAALDETMQTATVRLTLKAELWLMLARNAALVHGGYENREEALGEAVAEALDHCDWLKAHHMRETFLDMNQAKKILAQAEEIDQVRKAHGH